MMLRRLSLQIMRKLEASRPLLPSRANLALHGVQQHSRVHELQVHV